MEEATAPALTQVDLHARAADEVHGAALDRRAQRLGRTLLHRVGLE